MRFLLDFASYFYGAFCHAIWGDEQRNVPNNAVDNTLGSGFRSFINGIFGFAKYLYRAFCHAIWPDRQGDTKSLTERTKKIYEDIDYLNNRLDKVPLKSDYTSMKKMLAIYDSHGELFQYLEGDECKKLWSNNDMKIKFSIALLNFIDAEAAKKYLPDFTNEFRNDFLWKYVIESYSSLNNHWKDFIPYFKHSKFVPRPENQGYEPLVNCNTYQEHVFEKAVAIVGEMEKQGCREIAFQQFKERRCWNQENYFIFMAEYYHAKKVAPNFNYQSETFLTGEMQKPVVNIFGATLTDKPSELKESAINDIPRLLGIRNFCFTSMPQIEEAFTILEGLKFSYTLTLTCKYFAEIFEAGSSKNIQGSSIFALPIELLMPSIPRLYKEFYSSCIPTAKMQTEATLNPSLISVLVSGFFDDTFVVHEVLNKLACYELVMRKARVVIAKASALSFF